MSLVLGLGLEHSCPWPREGLSSERLSLALALASSIPVLGLERVCPRKGCPWPWPWLRNFFVSLALALASSLVSSTPPLETTSLRRFKILNCYSTPAVALGLCGSLKLGSVFPIRVWEAYHVTGSPQNSSKYCFMRSIYLHSI